MVTPILRSLVRDNLPETWKVLSTEADPKLIDNDSETPDIVDTALARVVDRWFVDTTGDPPEDLDPEWVEENEGKFVMGVVADMATRLVITPAIDYYMVRTRTSDPATPANPQGIQGLGGDASVNYNRVQGLRDLDKDIALRIAADMAEFLILIAPVEDVHAVSYVGPRVSSMGEKMKTQDPDSMPAIKSRRRFRPWPIF